MEQKHCMTEVIALNLTVGQVMFSDGTIGEIHMMFDEDGDIVEDPLEAVICIIQCPGCGKWKWELVSDYNLERTLH